MGGLAIRKPSHSAAFVSPAAKRDHLAAFTVDGDVVLADISDYKLDGKSLAVVARWDGSIGLEYAKTADGRFWAGERSGFHGAARERGIVSVGCVILGRVIPSR